MAKSSIRKRPPIAIIAAIIGGTAVIIAGILTGLLPILLKPSPSEVAVTAHVAEMNSKASVPGAKVLLLYEGGAVAEYTDGNGIASFKVNLPNRGEARLFVESDAHEIHDQTVQLSGNQSPLCQYR